MRYVEILLPPECESVELLPLCDIHPEEPSFKPKVFSKLMDWVLEKPNRIPLGLGDSLNCATKNGKSDIYNPRMQPDEALDWVMQEFGRLVNDTTGFEYRLFAEATAREKRIECVTRSRFPLLLPGNHEERVYRDTGYTIPRWMAHTLGAAYDDAGILLNIRLGKAQRYTDRKEAHIRHDGQPISYLIYMTHGSGGGRKVGGKANWLSGEAENVVADVYMVGHTHQSIGFRDVVFVPNVQGRFIEERERLYVNSASFLGWATYAERKGMRPGSSMMPVLQLDGRVKSARVLV